MRYLIDISTPDHPAHDELARLAQQYPDAVTVTRVDSLLALASIVCESAEQETARRLLRDTLGTSEPRARLELVRKRD